MQKKYLCKKEMARQGISCYTEIVHLLDMLLVMQAGSDGTGVPVLGTAALLGPFCFAAGRYCQQQGG